MIINAQYLYLFNWAIEAQTGDYHSSAIPTSSDVTAESTLAVLRNQEFLSEIAPVQHRECIDEVSDEMLLGALQVYLQVAFEDEAKLALETLNATSK